MIYTYITRRKSHVLQLTSRAGEEYPVTCYDETEPAFIDRVVDEAAERGDDLVTVQYFTDHRGEISRAVVTMKMKNHA